jgi:hypothetical protein
MTIFVLLIFFFNFPMYHMSEIVFAEQPDQVNIFSQWIVLTLLCFLIFTLYSLLIPKNDYVSRLAMKTINETIENWQFQQTNTCVFCFCLAMFINNNNLITHHRAVIQTEKRILYVSCPCIKLRFTYIWLLLTRKLLKQWLWNTCVTNNHGYIPLVALPGPFLTHDLSPCL